MKIAGEPAFWHAKFLAGALDGGIPLNVLAILFERAGSNHLDPVTVQSRFQKVGSINWVSVGFATEQAMEMIDIEHEAACCLVHRNAH